jgi:hypothetical protein
MRLPTFTIASMVPAQALHPRPGERPVAKVFYPVFPPARNAADVRDWLAAPR